MKSNKQKWADRHEQGLTKLDIANEAETKAMQAKIEENNERSQEQDRKRERSLVHKQKSDAVVEAAVTNSGKGRKKAAAVEPTSNTD